MSVTVKYKGNSIAELTENGTKTLKTSGKYCEADIVVENTKDGGATISDGIVINEMDATGYATKIDYYGETLPRCAFGAARGDLAYFGTKLQEINLKNDSVYLTWQNFTFCPITELNTDKIKGRSPLQTWTFNLNTHETSIFRSMPNLITLSLPEFEGFLNHYEVASCKKLKTVYLPKVTKACSYDTKARGSFRDCTALETVQLGSVGYAVDEFEGLVFQNCTSSFALTMYTTGAYADTLLTLARNGATKATITLKAAEDTEYNGRVYAAGADIISSSVAGEVTA